jgi:hypothetical protein
LSMAFLAYDIFHAFIGRNQDAQARSPIGLRSSARRPPSPTISCPTPQRPPQLSVSPSLPQLRRQSAGMPIRTCSDRTTPANSFRYRCLTPPHNPERGTAEFEA